jgi:hypothetical protein
VRAGALISFRVFAHSAQHNLSAASLLTPAKQDSQGGSPTGPRAQLPENIREWLTLQKRLGSTELD